MLTEVCNGSLAEVIQLVDLCHTRHVTVALLSPLFHFSMVSSANSSKSGAPSSGLLSNVFGFFSREIESFVTNAAGGSVQASEPERDREMFNAED